MLNLSRIQLELEKAKEGLREVEETIQKVEGKGFSNGPGRYSGLKVELHPDKGRNLQSLDDGKIRRRIVTNSDSRNQRISADDLSYTLKRGPRDKRDGGPPAKRQPQSIFARLSGIVRPKPAEEEDDDDFQRKKPALSSRVITTSAEAPSRQEVIAAQTADEKSKQRNKRMFSALLGTLQTFRREETRDKEREEKRQKVEKKLEEDAKRERERLMQEKRELFLERKRREVEIKRIEWSLNRVKEYEAWEANVLPLNNFIRTQAKPHVFYLPRAHNHKTQERLAQSQKIVEKMIERRKTNLKEEIENSERKARRTVAEVAKEAEEEEAENIPQDDDNQVVEQQMEIDFDFDAVDKENGYHEDGPKENVENLENADQDETMQDLVNEEKTEQEDSKLEEEMKEEVTMQNEEMKINQDNDDKGGVQIADDGGGQQPETESNSKSDPNITMEVPISDISELKNVETKPEDLVTERPKKPDEINLPNQEPNISEDKKKESEASRRRDRSRSRKGTKRTRSSRSPRRSRSRTPRSRRNSRKSRSRSRRKNTKRRSRSVSASPSSPKKSRNVRSGRRRSERKRSNSKSPSPRRQTKSRTSRSSSKSHSN